MHKTNRFSCLRNKLVMGKNCLHQYLVKDKSYQSFKIIKSRQSLFAIQMIWDRNLTKRSFDFKNIH